MSKFQNFPLIQNFFISFVSPFLYILRKMFPFNNFFGINTNNMELYPRRRATEFYYEPQPLEEYQSRHGEHPEDKLQKMESKPSSSDWQQELANPRITPPRNSDMRMFRNSYFS